MLSQSDSGLPLRNRLVLYAIGVLFYYLFCISTLWHSPNQFWGMYGNTDGMWAAWNHEAILKWGYPFDLSPYNILSGMGSMFAPNLPWLNPGALSLGLPLDQGARYAISYTVYLLELLISLIVLMRVIGLSPLRSVVVAQLYALVLFPPTSGWFLALSWYSLAPFNAHLVALANFALCLFLKAGTYNFQRNLVCILGMLFLMICAIVSAPISFLTYVPIYVVMALALALERSPSRNEVMWKAISIAALGVLPLALGFPQYLTATGELSARSESFSSVKAFSLTRFIEMTQEAWRRFEVCERPQELLCHNYPVFWFHVCAVAGAVVGLFRPSSRFKLAAAMFLLYYAGAHVWEVASKVQLFGKLHVISVPYLVWGAYAFFALFATELIFLAFGHWRGLKRVTRGGERTDARSHISWPSRISAALIAPRWRFLLLLLMTLAVPLTANHIWTTHIRGYFGPSPVKTKNSIFGFSRLREPVVGAITRYLVEHATLRPGGAFRGYTVTYFGDPNGHIRRALTYPQQNMGWEVHVLSRAYLDIHYGNRFKEMDLWQFNIPSIEEYGQWVSTQAQLFVSQLFSSPGDAPKDAMLQLYKLDANLLAASGVRFVITDIELPSADYGLRVSEHSPTAGSIHLYELRSPNLATYSPTEMLRIETFKSAMDAMQANSTRLDRAAVVFDELKGDFVRASQAQMRAERDGFRVIAKSTGHSALLLPVQYSRCLKMTSITSDTPSTVRLVRANGPLALLIFDRDIDVRVRFQFGLFGSATCRRQDAQDLREIGVTG